MKDSSSVFLIDDAVLCVPLMLPLLYVGTLVSQAGIAFINVLLPSLIQANEAKSVRILNHTLQPWDYPQPASSVAVPITRQPLRCRPLTTAVCALALVVWLPNVRLSLLRTRYFYQQPGSWYKSGKVWAIMIFGGLQSLLVLYHYHLASNHGHSSRCRRGYAKFPSFTQRFHSL